jgi:hypothetical protein
MAGQYEVVIIYTAKSQATFKLSVGTFDGIKAGTAPSLTAQLPALVSGLLSYFNLCLHVYHSIAELITALQNTILLHMIAAQAWQRHICPPPHPNASHFKCFLMPKTGV